MNHASLFTGIGGFDLAAEWMGWENVFHCDKNEFVNHVTQSKWQHSIQYDDIKTTDFTIFRGRIDILTGGFPCQPYSTAGKRLGKDDERHLWPEMLRAIREIAPSFVVGENVRGLLSWNGGMVFDEVQADLEAEGYEVIPFLLPACGVNAPHRRDRIWFVAFNAKRNANGGHNTGESERNGREMVWNFMDQAGWIESPNNTESSSSNASNSTDPRIESLRREREYSIYGCEFITDSKNTRQQTRTSGSREKQSGRRNSGMGIPNYWANFPTQSPICIGNDGVSDEPLRQRIRDYFDGEITEKEITKIIKETEGRWRKEVIMAAGNAVVPQVVMQIFKAIELLNQ